MILHVTPSTYIISHKDSIKYTIADDSLEKCDTVDQFHIKSYQLTPDLFKIHKPFITNTHKNLGAIASKLEIIYNQEILPYFDSLNKDKTLSKQEEDNSIAVQTAQEFFSQTDYAYEKFHGANPTGSVVVTEFNGTKYLFPPNSRFFNCDLFTYEFGEKEKYDLVVIDPPWKNKFIKRRKGNKMGYDTHTSETIENLRLGSILSENGILAMWSTNGKTEQILNEMMAKWGLVHVTTFYWLKVTTTGKVTCPFTKQDGKQPYESLILATNSEIMKNYPMKILVSTPSAINSHKPPLTEVLEDYFQRKFVSKCELFARYLLPDYNSYGNQVLKLNVDSLFLKVMK